MSHYYSVLVITVVVINGLHCMYIYIYQDNGQDKENWELCATDSRCLKSTTVHKKHCRDFIKTTEHRISSLHFKTSIIIWSETTRYAKALNVQKNMNQILIQNPLCTKNGLK